MKPWRAALTSATASGKSTRIASRRAIACSSEPPSTRTCPSAAAVSSTAVFSVSVANCSRCASCTDSACCSANSRSPRISSSGSPPNGNPNPPSTPDTLAARGRSESEHAFLQPGPAVEREHLAGDVARVVGDEEGTGVRNLVLAAEAAQRHLGEHRGTDLLRRPEPLARLRRVDGTRSDRVHADPVRRPLDGERAREVDDAGLRRRRVDGAWPARPGVRRDDVHDLAASAALDRPPPELPRAEEGAVEDDPEDGAPAVRREVLRPHAEVARGVVHERRHGSELPLGGFERGRDRLRVAHVARDGEPTSELAYHLPERPAPPAGDGHAGAEPPELDGHRAPEPGAAAGDERDAAAERPLGEHHRREGRESSSASAFPAGRTRQMSVPPKRAKPRTRTRGVPGRAGTSAPCSSMPPNSARPAASTSTPSGT